MSKTCKICNVEKSITEYYKAGKYYQPYCKPCNKKNNTKYVATWTKNNPDKAKRLSEEWRTRDKGVYNIIAENEIVYIGGSKRINDRMSKHRCYFKNTPDDNSQKEMYEDMRRKYTSITVEPLEITDNYEERERFYINMYDPIYNRI